MKTKRYDIGIVGGGLAGLALSIEEAKKGRSVVLFEKKSFPYHKVCGEYISNESWNYILSLGVDLVNLDLPKINQIKISTVERSELNHELQMGGFGISRYLLDYELSKIAKKHGVELLENCRVINISQQQGVHSIQTESKKNYEATIAVGAYGKRSKLDKKLNRDFSLKTLKASQNYVGIKYHVKADLPENLISLHIFKDGYCGISKVEQNKYCLCYLTLASNLQDSGSIALMEQTILSQNPYLKEHLTYERLYDSPLVISQINFNHKNIVEDDIFMLGDAAGLIVPLCGNGMSMALRSAHEFSKMLDAFFSNKLSKKELKTKYSNWWQNEFRTRLYLGRKLQKLFYYPKLVNPTIKLLSKMPWLTNKIIAFTHGKNIQ